METKAYHIKAIDIKMYLELKLEQAKIPQISMKFRITMETKMLRITLETKPSKNYYET